MKKIVLLFMAILAVSCSGDSDSATSNVPKKITFTGLFNQVYKLTYDSEKRITKVECSGDLNNVVTFTYDGANLTGIMSHTGDDYAFAYHPNGVMSHVGINGETMNPVPYNSQANSYSFDGDPLAFYNNWDINVYQGNTFTYDTSREGVFYHAGAPVTLMGIFVDGAFLFCSSKLPLISTPFLEMTHTYDDSGRIIHTSTLSGMDFQIDYEY